MLYPVKQHDILVPLVGTLSPSDVKDVRFHPGLVLPAHLDVSILNSESYGQAAEDGFESYFIQMYQDDEQQKDMRFIPHHYTRQEVLQFVTANSTLDNPPDWTAGFLVGWLSALALTDYASAIVGLRLTEQLITYRRPLTLASRTVGLDGWPLDM